MDDVWLRRFNVVFLYSFVTVLVLNVADADKTSNDISFPFSLYETFINEGKEIRKNFFAVKAKTSSTLPVRYGMTSLIDSRSQNFFDIDKDTGELSTITEIDREFMSVHYFKVIATLDGSEKSSQTATTTVQISVKDLNDNRPIFEQSVYNATVRESLPIGSSIVTLRASDLDHDANGKVTYILESEGEDNFFRIDANSGVISLRSALDRELQAQHILNIVATDNAPPGERLSSNATVIMNLVDENDNVPMFTKRIYYIDIPEDHPVDSDMSKPVGKVTAVDADAGDNAAIKYSIIGGNKASVFNINSETGDIYLLQSLDREVQDSYKLIIRAQDLGSPPNSNTTQVIVNVQDVNDNSPRFPSANYYQSVAEDVPEGYSILQVTAFDPDQGKNSMIKYSLRDAQTTLPFMIEETTGWIKTSTVLDREVAGSYRFLVEAMDEGTPSQTALATIQITVLDRNDNDPVMAQRVYDVAVSESAPLGSEIVKVVANDPDENSELRYEIVSGNVGNVFSISMHQGVGLISIAQPLDFNKEQYYKLSVNAIDSGGRFATASVNINVTDSNNHAPRFENTPYVVDVFEDTPVGSTVLMLFATDLDHGKNAKISYRMLPPFDKFTVERETGALVVAGALDRESMPTFSLTVIAEDGGISPLADQTEVEISVVDVNDNAPRFSSTIYQGSVNENSPAGTSILEVSATDDDAGENGKVYYRFVGKSDDERAFTIDSISGIVRTKRPLDRETREYYDLMVEAHDAGIPEMSTIVHVGITVLDLNDNPPRFPNDTITFNFPENLPSGSKVGTITVQDPDIGQNAIIKFRLLKNADEKYFFIDDSSTTGSTVLYSKREFDYEVDRREYQLLLRAESEPLRTDALVIVQLSDVNDNHPTIEDFDIVFNNRINEYFSGAIGYIPAKDADPTSQLQYNFTYGNNANLLQLDSRSGQIRLSPSIKSNVNVEAKVGVSVTDGKNEARANFRLRLNYVTEKMLEHSVTLRLANVTAPTFLTPFYQYLIEGLSVVIPCDKNQIQIFSVKPDDVEGDVKILNVTFSATMSGTHDEQYLDPAYVKQRIYLHKDLLQKLLLLEFLPFDDNICVREPCLNFEKCSSILKFGNEEKTYESKTLMFRSVDPVRNYACTCPVGFTGMKTRYTCDTKINLCYSNPCQNAATCVARENGFVCLCPENFAGKTCNVNLTSNVCSDELCHGSSNCVPSSVNSGAGRLVCRNCSDNPFFDEFCQLRSRSFSKGSYAAFPALSQRNEFNISLEFTTQSDGVVFYNGRLNDENDFIALEVLGKSVVFKYSTGDKVKSVSVSRKRGYSDGEFHRVEVFYSNETATLSVGEKCDKKLALKFGESLRDELRCANKTSDIETSAQKCGFYSGKCTRFLDLNGPFILGGIPDDSKGINVLSASSFIGCVSNVYIDRQLVNLDMMVHNNGSISGCPEKRDFCNSSPCKNNGKCANGWGSYSCTCKPQWTGKNCGTAVGRVFGMDRGSELTFQQELSPIQLPWQMSLSFRTKSANASLLSVKMGDDSDVYKIEIRDGAIVFVHHDSILVSSHNLINDNIWHDAQIKWMEGEVWLNIDYGQYEITQRSFDTVAGKIATKITAGTGENAADDDSNAFFRGCIQNVRVGSRENANVDVVFEKNIAACKEDETAMTLCKDGICDKNEDLKIPVEKCSIADNCVCPFDKKECLQDSCKLDLCSAESVCSFAADGNYQCRCKNEVTQMGKYCDPVDKEVCPSHWWGSPVCGPCNCDTAHGFNESCDAVSGKCRCKEHHYVAPGGKKGDEMQCMPCNCYAYGSLDEQCEVTTGRCHCKTGVSGFKCDACAHDFAELTSKGCHVIYGACPAEFKNDIWWPRTTFGETQNATCPDKSIGSASRLCQKTGWTPPDLSGCIHEEFLHLSQMIQNRSSHQESWVIIQKTKDLTTNSRKFSKAGSVQDSTRMQQLLHDKDIAVIEKAVYIVLDQESQASGFQLAHKKDREFLDNFLGVVSWIIEKQNASKMQDVRLVSAVAEYGSRLADSMEMTFTNPFEIITENVIFGLDTIKNPGNGGNGRIRRQAEEAEQEVTTVKIPKYNNYMKKTNNWNRVSSYLTLQSNPIYKLQYTVYKTRKASVERKFLFVPNLLWGTAVNLFSEILSVTVRQGSGEAVAPQSDEDRPRIVTFSDRISKPQNQLHCVTWDRDLWNAIDCETDRRDDFDFSDDGEDNLIVSINCTCQSGRIFAVVEESIADGRDYLDSRTESVVFSICSSVSLAMLLITTLSLTCLNSAQKTSVRVHRNIAFSVLILQVLVLIIVLINTQLTELPFLCTFISMCLHYFSVAMFTWIMIDSVHIYRMLSELRDINHGRMTFYAGAGFGIPAVVVGLTVGVSGNNYAAPSFCWLSYYHSSVWGMIGPEIGCAIIHTVTMLFNLKIVFRVKNASDIEDDFRVLRTVFFVNLGLLPLAGGFHAAALIMINERAPMSIYIFVALALIFSFYLLCGFMLADKAVLRALASCTSKKGAKHRGGPPLTSQRGISRSSLTYRQSTSTTFKHKPPTNNLDVAEVSVASTTSQSTYQTSSKIKASTFDDLDVTRSYNLQHSQNSESDSDMDRRSLDLASSHTSDDEYDTNNMYEPSDLKALSVNDYPQY